MQTLVKKSVDTPRIEDLLAGGHFDRPADISNHIRDSKIQPMLTLAGSSDQVRAGEKEQQVPQIRQVQQVGRMVNMVDTRFKAKKDEPEVAPKDVDHELDKQVQDLSVAMQGKKEEHEKKEEEEKKDEHHKEEHHEEEQHEEEHHEEGNEKDKEIAE